MGKQARMRREKIRQYLEHSEKQSLTKVSRVYDNCLAVGMLNGVVFGDHRFAIMDAEAIDITDVLPLVKPEFQKTEFNVTSDRIVNPAFPNMFFEVRGFSFKSTPNWFVDLGIWVVYREYLEGESEKNRYEALLYVFVRSGEMLKRLDHIGRFWVDVNGGVEGFAIEHEVTSKPIIPDERDQLSHAESIDVEYIAHSLAIVFYSLTLLNCRNIELMEHSPDAEASKLYQRHYGHPLTKHKTLRIKPFGKRTDRESDEKEYQGLMPLHIRRGNFAHYTDDAPLFGKFTGTFWRPATVVGEEKRGVVVKDYKVLPPEDKAS